MDNHPDWLVLVYGPLVIVGSIFLIGSVVHLFTEGPRKTWEELTDASNYRGFVVLYAAYFLFLSGIAIAAEILEGSGVSGVIGVIVALAVGGAFLGILDYLGVTL